MFPSACAIFSCPYAYPRTCQCARWCAGRHSPSVRFVHTPLRPTVVPPFVARSSFVVRPASASASAHAHRIYNHTSHIRFSAPLPPAFACAFAAVLPVVVCPQPPSLLLPLTIFDPLLTTASSRALSLIFILSLPLILAVSLSAAPIIPFRHFTLRTFIGQLCELWVFGLARAVVSGLVWSGRSCVRACGSSLPPLSRSSPCVALVPMTLPPSSSPALLSYTGLRTFTLCSSAHRRARPSPGRPSDALSHGQ
ncbi:hypothetical protein C8Q70DRAFT_691045 [Cubamyces menziesii]|nr:hypothetical protein C8Q70DRAFT_691045 [Cubamyces menziesii]